MRVLVAGIIGGLIFFLWGFVSHTMLPIGDMGMQVAPSEEPVLEALRSNLPSEGVYLVPGMAPETRSDPAAQKAYSERAKASPYAFVVYQPVGTDGMAMGTNLVKQVIGDTLAALVVAFILALGPFAFGKRVMIATAMGLFAWFAISVPYWNWYRFPLEFTIGSLLGQVVGWFLAGLGIAWWLGRRHR